MLWVTTIINILILSVRESILDVRIPRKKAKKELYNEKIMFAWKQSWLLQLSMGMRFMTSYMS